MIKLINISNFGWHVNCPLGLVRCDGCKATFLSVLVQKTSAKKTVVYCNFYILQKNHTYG